MTGYPPSIELARLYERTSARGTQYMLGRLGAARIVLLPGEPAEDGTATWRLLVQEGADAADGSRLPLAAPAADRPPVAPARRQRRPYPTPRPDQAAGDGPPLDDPLGDLWPGDGGGQ